MGTYEVAVCDICGSESKFEYDYTDGTNCPSGWSSGYLGMTATRLYGLGGTAKQDMMVCSPQCALIVIGSFYNAIQTNCEIRLNKKICSMGVQ